MRLADFDPDGETLPGILEKDGAQLLLARLKHELQELQRRLYAERRRGLLVILQSMDGGGKDGTVRHVFGGIDPHGLRAVSFKSPTPAELDHDFLWRVHQAVPARGEIVVFNRSHYEDVVAARVKNLTPRERWEKRFAHIVNFERMLADEGTTILKFYLHISREEQARRLKARLADPEKQWKFHADDLADRRLWPQFMSAYEEALARTAAEDAPWFIVPANRKWYRNLIIATVVRDALLAMKPRFPAPDKDLSKFKVE